MFLCLLNCMIAIRKTQNSSLRVTKYAKITKSRPITACFLEHECLKLHLHVIENCNSRILAMKILGDLFNLSQAAF